MSYFIILLYLIINTSTHIIHLKTCRLPNICTEMKNCNRFEIVTLTKRSYCGFSTNFKVCCPELNTTSPTSTSALRVIRKNDEIASHEKFRFLPIDKCGEVSSKLRITSGTSTSLQEFPWMALIRQVRNSSRLLDFKCGGTLISQNYVLTAAHCTYNATVLGVRLGEYDLNSDVDCDPNFHMCKTPVQDLSIDKIKSHPFYNPDSFANDIALIRLGKPANFTDGNVKPICLPFDELLHTNLEGMNLTAAGWGKTDQGENSSILRKVSVPVMPFSTCQALYSSIKPITEKQICAGEGGRDSCAGDSGGPLKTVHYINSSPRYVQYGIVSFGPSKCGLSTRPGVYTNVQKYMKWILDNLSR